MKIKTISEGMTNSYLVPGFVVLVLGCAAFVLSPFIAIPVLVLAVALFVSTSGVQIDPEKKVYRTYMSLFTYKIGPWRSFSNVTEVTLVLSSEHATVHGLTAVIGIARSASVRVLTYDVFINDGINQIELNDFSTYKSAREAFVYLNQSLNINGRDLVAEKLAANRAKRSR